MAPYDPHRDIQRLTIIDTFGPRLKTPTFAFFFVILACFNSCVLQQATEDDDDGESDAVGQVVQAVLPPACTSSSTSLCSITYEEPVNSRRPAWLCQNLIDCPTGGPSTITRTAVVWPGDGSDPTPSVVWYFHGSAEGNGAETSAADANLNIHITWPQAIVIYGQATPLTDHSGAWRPSNDGHGSQYCWSPRHPYVAASGVHSDVNYVQAVLDDVAEMFDYDDSEIFAAGHSSGAYFTLTLSEVMPETFRAFAAVGAYTWGKSGEEDAVPAVVASGQRLPSRPVLYLMGSTRRRIG
jgi:hypothetical protein